MTQRIIYQNDFPYFVTCNTYYNKQLLNNFIYANILHKNILHWTELYNIILYAFCILPNHMHLMFMLRHCKDISPYMMKIKSKTAQDIHFWSRGKLCSVKPVFSSHARRRLPCQRSESRGKPRSVEPVFTPHTERRLRRELEHRLRRELKRENQLIKHGSIWQPRYNFRIINNEDRLINTLNYIRYNYLKHGHGKKYSKLPFQYFDYDNIDKLL